MPCACFQVVEQGTASCGAASSKTRGLRVADSGRFASTQLGPRADGSARAARASASRCRSTRRIHTAFPRVALVHARPALSHEQRGATSSGVKSAYFPSGRVVECGCVWGTRRSQKVTLLVALNFYAPLRHAMADACTRRFYGLLVRVGIVSPGSIHVLAAHAAAAAIFLVRRVRARSLPRLHVHERGRRCVLSAFWYASFLCAPFEPLSHRPCVSR